ncbi:DUF2787 domain-containing protein [Shewanella sp. KJ2020]|uniref:DUF2787 domain-containing protein n=1 Tax=Shewanella sp. KJ2020 TaxID=2919172 RepID=UPI0020A81339|nr:DUF2787 domain-containing protein [Shewanella sp. KJ2020]MCP3128809.1 DUF2787 domain-containing protein [Shewanella sp. KJ2020]
MKLIINRNQLPLMPNRFYQVIEKELADVDPKDANAITLNFRDPDYSAEDGGFHPVEVRLEKQQEHWRLVYVTDFAFRGHPFPELVKDIDICFNSKQVYSLFSGWIGERECRALIDLFTQNFATNFVMGVYKVKVSLD